jgi:hypothetical protein
MCLQRCPVRSGLRLPINARHATSGVTRDVVVRFVRHKTCLLAATAGTCVASAFPSTPATTAPGSLFQLSPNIRYKYNNNVCGSAAAAPRSGIAHTSHAPRRGDGFSCSAGAPCGHAVPAEIHTVHRMPVSPHDQSRISSARFRLSAASEPMAPDSRYSVTYDSPKLADSPSATSGANPAPTSHARSDVSAAPV